MIEKGFAVAIDGPADAGRSTIAKELAARLGFIYVDTEALYRAIGYYAYGRLGETGTAAKVTALLPEISLDIKCAGGEQRIYLNGEDVSEAIRSNKMSLAAAIISSLPLARDFLLELQLRLARENNVVMDGRDIGTAILPGAQVKFFLTAPPEERARRRALEYEQEGFKVDFEKILAETKQRDYKAAPPLKQAEDAVPVDSTGMTLSQVIDKMAEIVKDKGCKISGGVSNYG